MDKGCRNCVWVYDMVVRNPAAPCSECVDYDKWCTMKQTNGDCVRRKSDEELAEWFWWMLKHVQGYTDSRCALLDWLRQEAKDG